MYSSSLRILLISLIALITFGCSHPRVEMTACVDLSFTCTGMTYNTVDSCWYIGNIGARSPKDDFQSSIMVMNSDFTAVKRQLSIYEVFPEMVDVQGVAVNESDQSIWFCSFSEDMVRHITADCQSLDSLSVGQPTGIAFQQDNRHIWVLTFTELQEYDSNKHLLRRYKHKLHAPDQIVILGDRILITRDDDYQKEQHVSVYSIPKNKIETALVVAQSFAIEGISIKDSLVYIANDGAYHQAKIARNQVNLYPLSAFKRIIDGE